LQNPSLAQNPEQQARSVSQRSLRCAQRQAPFSHRREQQSASLLQRSSLSPQSQLPLRQRPEQQQRSALQLAPWPPHTHLPLLRLLRPLFWHFSEQQLPSLRHRAPLTRQSASRSTSPSCAIRARREQGSGVPRRLRQDLHRRFAGHSCRPPSASSCQNDNHPRATPCQCPTFRLRGQTNRSILKSHYTNLTFCQDNRSP
jgi:hypothetical protein